MENGHSQNLETKAILDNKTLDIKVQVLPRKFGPRRGKIIIVKVFEVRLG